jgi:hypothetical protein
MPTKNDSNPPKIAFEKFGNQMKVGYVLYADFECLLRPLSKCQGSNQTTKEKRHIPTGFSYALVKETGDLVTYRVYRGKDAIEVFLQDCLKIAANVLELYAINVSQRLTARDEEVFQSAISCHICDKPFDDDGDVKCRDHNHLTGKLSLIDLSYFIVLY